MSAKLSLDSSYDLEQQFILRMTDLAAAENLAADIEAGVSFKDNFTIEFKPDMRHCIVRYNNQVYDGHVMDLPCIIESLKTTDKRSFYKTADVCQMMICTQGEESGPLRGTAAYLDDRTKSWKNVPDASRENREFQFLHGITPPLKNVLRRRFRKSRRKRFVDMPKIEKEVKQLLRADLQAVAVKWEVIWSEQPTAPGQAEDGAGSSLHGGVSRDIRNLTGPSDTSGTIVRNAAADDELEEEEEASRAYAIDRRDVFGDISSSSVDSSDSSDDEHTRDGTKRRSTEAMTISARPSFDIASQDRDLSGRQSTIDVARGSEPFADTIGLGALKDELAAELLLSDSGDEAEKSPLIRQQLHVDAELEGDLQATVAAQLIAHASSDPRLMHDVVVDGVDDDLDDEDEMAHQGGELLDDSVLISFEGDGHRFTSHLESEEDSAQ